MTDSTEYKYQDSDNNETRSKRIPATEDAMISITATSLMASSSDRRQGDSSVQTKPKEPCFPIRYKSKLDPHT